MKLRCFEKFAPETHDRRFQSAVGTVDLNRQNETRERWFQTALSFGGFITADHNHRFGPETIKSIRSQTTIQSAVWPPITTAISQKVVKPRRRQMLLQQQSSC